MHYRLTLKRNLTFNKDDLLIIKSVSLIQSILRKVSLRLLKSINLSPLPIRIFKDESTRIPVNFKKTEANVTRKDQKTGLLSLKNYSECFKLGPSRCTTGEITKYAVYLRIV